MPPPSYADILVVDLLGGFGDLLTLLPAVHGLARRHRGATLRLLTHEPGADLVRRDPAVAEVLVPRHGRPGAEREAVAGALAARRPDLAVTTTRYDGIPDLLTAGAGRAVTDLWRRPPPGQSVGGRYLQILHHEGLLTADDLDQQPRVCLERDEIVAGDAVVGRRLPVKRRRPPVLFATAAGMRVKRWPRSHWRRLAQTLGQRGHPVLTIEPAGDLSGVPLPPGSLRQLAGYFHAIGRRGGLVVGGDTGPVRLAAAAGARTVALFGPTTAARYGMSAGVDLQGLPGCPHRNPTSITEQVCWWTGHCPLSTTGPACLADLSPDAVAAAVTTLVNAA